MGHACVCSILIAALTCCRTDEELNEVLVPELAHKFTACADNIFVRTINLVLCCNLTPLCNRIEPPLISPH